MHSAPLSPRQITLVWLVGALAAASAGAGLRAIVGIEQARRQGAEKLVLQARVANVRARLESELNATLSLSLGLSSFVLSRPDFTREQLDRVSAALIRAQPAIRNIGVAPDNVIRYVYPLAGNEKALGLRYLDSPAQRGAVLRLMREQRPVVAGPIALVQGGEGIVNRIPVVFATPDGGARYWGLASVVIDPRPIYRDAGLDDPGMRYALRGRDGLGAAGATFLGEPALFADPRAVRMDVVIPGGKWQLAALPARIAPDRTPLADGLIALAALAFGGLAASAARGHQRIRNLALADSLTGLANRRQFLLRGEQIVSLAQRSGRPLTLLNLDIDGFKNINDTHGHAVGDQVLAQVAAQMRATFRQSDLLARIGGDEFLALLPDTAADARLDALIARLREATTMVFPGERAARPIRLSIGVAALNGATALDALMREADRTMYRAKRENRRA